MREKYLWLIGINEKLGTIEIHRNDPNNPLQVSHLIAVEKIIGVKVPKEVKRRKQQVLDILVSLDHNSDSR